MHPFELFFHERYASAYAAERRMEQERRSAAFLEIAEPVAGLPLRALTAYDLFLLDGHASPFVCGDPAHADRDHITAVLWLLRVDRVTGGGLREWWAYHKHRAHLRHRWHDPDVFLQDHATLNLWFAAIFADVPGSKSREHVSQPLGTHFLAGLLVPLASEMGAIDPASGKPLIHAPVARLCQYAKVLERRKAGENHIEFNPSDRLKGQALAAYNALTAEQRAVWIARATPSPV